MWKSKNSLKGFQGIDNRSARLSGSAEINFENETHNIEEDDDCFTIGLNEIHIPFKNLDCFEILQNVDLKYFYAKCRDALKKIYDQDFK